MEKILQKDTFDPFTVDLIDEKTASEILNVAPGTLAVWRCTKRYRIPFIKVGRSVRYDRKALYAWIAQHTHNDDAQL